MKIMLIGYGKMGKTIEQIALNRGHQVPVKIDVNNHNDLLSASSKTVDAAIEFTQPESAFENVKACLERGIPVVCGTTGWLERKKEIEEICKSNSGAFFYASNYSIGVNIFFHLNKYLANVMKNFPEYQIEMEEIHHTQKKDAPSGTAITLAEGIFEKNSSRQKWVNERTNDPNSLGIISKRIENVPGTHTIFYESKVDTIEIKHTAHSREGFAGGAVTAAEWLVGKKGVFGMDDMLKF